MVRVCTFLEYAFSSGVPALALSWSSSASRLNIPSVSPAATTTTQHHRDKQRYNDGGRREGRREYTPAVAAQQMQTITPRRLSQSRDVLNFANPCQVSRRRDRLSNCDVVANAFHRSGSLSVDPYLFLTVRLLLLVGALRIGLRTGLRFL